MSIISALAEAYKHIPNAPQPGFAKEKISAVFVLRADGTVTEAHDIRIQGKKKLEPKRLSVPKPPKRTSGLSSGFLWDKTAYALGLTAAPTDKTAEQHCCFIEYHQKLLNGTADEGLLAFLRFLQAWNPQGAQPAGWNDDLLDENIAFILEADFENKQYLHLRPAAQEIWAKTQAAEAGEELLFCPIIGAQSSVARLHPVIKGVFGGQSSGTSLVSYQQESSRSYGHSQGQNAQISIAAAEAYTGALNLFLAKGSGHSMLIGDSTLAFWAEADNAATAKQAEESFATLLGDGPAEKDLKEQAEKDKTKKIDTLLSQIRQAKGTESAYLEADVREMLADNVRFYILGLAPNAARIVVRFFLQDSFAHILQNYQKYIEEMRIEPPARQPYPPFYQYVLETALLHKRENINPRLAAEWLQAILTGQNYPQALLAALLKRIAAERGNVNALRASILKAFLMRNTNKGEIKPMIDFKCKKVGYVLGRLFAVLEQTQAAAINAAFNEGEVNSSVLDRFYSSASRNPLKVFPNLIDNSKNHLRKLAKSSDGRKVGYGANLEKIIGSLMDKLEPEGGGYPMFFSLEEQALFGIGYYHQKNGYKATKATLKNEEME